MISSTLPVFFYFSFFLEKKRNKKLFAAFIFFLMELMRALRLVQGQLNASGGLIAGSRQKPFDMIFLNV
jgi:hypothetical protein